MWTFVMIVAHFMRVNFFQQFDFCTLRTTAVTAMIFFFFLDNKKTNELIKIEYSIASLLSVCRQTECN